MKKRNKPGIKSKDKLAMENEDLHARIARLEEERALRATGMTEEVIFNTLSELVIYQDVEGRILWANKAAGDAAGVPPEELGGRFCYEVYHGRKERCPGCPVRKTIVSGKAQEGEMLSLGRMWWFIKGYPVKDGRGEIIGIVEITREFTEQRRAETALRESEELYRTLVRTSPEAITVTDLQGRITFVSERSLRMNGAGDPADLLGTSAFDLIVPEQRAQAMQNLGRTLEQGFVEGIELTLVRKDGSRFMAEMNVALIRDAAGSPKAFISTVRDVTERKIAEAEMQRAQKLESIGILAGGIAHDFNNILTAVIGNISLAKLLARPGDEIYERLGEAGKAASIAKDLTQQLLTFSKGGAPVKRLASIRDLLADTSVFALSGSNVRADLDLSDDIWSVECDTGQICQVINNLVINAKQAMPEGGVIEIRAENVTVGGGDRLPLPPGTYVKFSVRDHGVGIAEENLPLIFDPYFTTKERGSGLGLASTYSIIRRHGGTVKVESRVGGGTTFEVFLPSTGKRAPRPGGAEAGPLRGSGRILVMDDEKMVRRAVSTLLASLGYEVECTVDGADMLQRYREAMETGTPFDAVIMDLTVSGGMGGKEAIRKLLELDPGARAIVSSGYSNDPIMANFRSHGFRGVIAKPYGIDDIGEVLARALQE